MRTSPADVAAMTSGATARGPPRRWGTRDRLRAVLESKSTDRRNIMAISSYVAAHADNPRTTEDEGVHRLVACRSWAERGSRAVTPRSEVRLPRRSAAGLGCRREIRPMTGFWGIARPFPAPWPRNSGRDARRSASASRISPLPREIYDRRWTSVEITPETLRWERRKKGRGHRAVPGGRERARQTWASCPSSFTGRDSIGPAHG
jgi:hypothetical protein